MTDSLPTENNNDSRGIVRKAGRGIFWNFLSFGLTKISLLVTTAILARLLDKSDFGLVSIAVIAINYLSIIKDLGLGTALIQTREDMEQASQTVFTVNILLGFFLTAAGYFIAPWVGTYFNDLNVIPVLRWLSLSFTINALGAVHLTWLVRDLNFQKKIIPELGNSIVKAILSISLAFAGAGVWALVFGQLAGSLASIILLWIINPWRPKFIIYKNVFKQLIRFGSTVTIGDLLGATLDNLDYIVIGKLFGTEKLSIYQLAYRLPEMILVGNLWVIGGVIFPAFSSIQHDLAELKKAFLISIRYVQMLALPISFGLFLAAQPLVLVVFGEKWIDVIPILRVISIYSLIYSFCFHVGDVYKAIGKPHLLVLLSTFQLSVLVPLLFLGAHYYGAIGVAWGQVIAIFLKRIVGLILAMRLVKVKPSEIFSEYKPSIISVLSMTPIVILTIYFVQPFNPFLQLISIVLSGAVSYLAVLWMLERNNLIKMIQKITKAK